jgi:hypothetical protein
MGGPDNRPVRILRRNVSVVVHVMSRTFGYISEPTDEYPAPKYDNRYVEQAENVPSNPAHYRQRLRLALEELPVGMSLFTDIWLQDVYGPITELQRKTGAVFTRRQMDGGVRIWRVE